MNILINDNKFDIFDSIKRTQKGDLFYLYDSGSECPNRVIIFSTKENLYHLSMCSSWIAEETFRSCPGNFYKIYTILGIFEGKFFPLVYFIMKRKTQISYEKDFCF
ncbi:hypothetical protein DMUE_2651 [Dictyocoela muelleri]|nr:hypothetical protein DMUE_2651 [Dictyocoela muelleri]